MTMLQTIETILLILLALGQVAGWTLKPWRHAERVDKKLDSIGDQVDEVRAAVLDLVQVQQVPEGSAIRRLRARESQRDREAG